MDDEQQAHDSKQLENYHENKGFHPEDQIKEPLLQQAKIKAENVGLIPQKQSEYDLQAEHKKEHTGATKAKGYDKNKVVYFGDSDDE